MKLLKASLLASVITLASGAAFASQGSGATAGVDLGSVYGYGNAYAMDSYAYAPAPGTRWYHARHQSWSSGRADATPSAGRHQVTAPYDVR